MDLYTRCPHCQTVFRLVSEQLEAAGGRVRCGACLRVFPARQYLVRPKGAATTSSTNPAAAAIEKKPVTSATAAPVTSTAVPDKTTIAPASAPSATDKLDLDFDSFFSAEALTPTAVPPTQPQSGQPAAESRPTPSQPDAPDFSLLEAALTHLDTDHDWSAPETVSASPIAPASARDKAPPAEPVAAHVPVTPPLKAVSPQHDGQPLFTQAPAASAAPASPSAPAPTVMTDDDDDWLMRTSPRKPAVLPSSQDRETSAPKAAPTTVTASLDNELNIELSDGDLLPNDEVVQTATPPPESAPSPGDSVPAAIMASTTPSTVIMDDETPSDSFALMHDEGEIDLADAPLPLAEPIFDDEPLAALDHKPLTALADKNSTDSDDHFLFDDVVGIDTDASDEHIDTPALAPAPALTSMAKEPVASAPVSNAATPAPAAPIPSPPAVLDDLALELPSDWASLKPSRRNEPVFDDDNGLDLEHDETPARAALKPNVPRTPEPSLGTTARPALLDDDFEFHLDAVDAAVAQTTVIGDWHNDQSDLVSHASADDVLLPTTPAAVTAKPAHRSMPTKAATSAGANAVHKPITREAKPGTDSDAIVAADFGDINNDWDKPKVQLQTPDAITADPVPQPFDAEGFTADATDRIYGPANDNDDSSNWTVADTDPHSDYDTTFYPPEKRRLPWRGLLLAVVALLLIPVLVMQLLWPQRAALREDPQWGPWVESVCAQIECELPPRSDISKIHLQQKSVLKDRDDARKLQIDLLIANKADFAQPYPDILLRFTNIEGELVAERRFKPAEYLREQPDSDQMPTGVPVHIAFSVRAPEGNVTGYEFNFLPPQL